MFIVMWRKDGEKTKQAYYQTEKGMKEKVEELNKDDRTLSVRIFKEITYGEQQSLFDAKFSPF